MRKKIIMFLLMLAVLPIGLLGCSLGHTETDKSDIDKGNGTGNNTVVPEKYTVTISLNNTEAGSLNIDNVKSEYDGGDIINITVAPKHGYYLKGYSDLNSFSPERQIVVSKNMNIVVDLQEGDFCDFYGYKIARNCSSGFYGLSNPQNDETYYVKDHSYIREGDLGLRVKNLNNFGYFLLKNSTTQKVITEDLGSYGFYKNSIVLTEQNMIDVFGDQKDELIEIEEFDTLVGKGYYMYRTESDQCEAAKIELDKFDKTQFGDNLSYAKKINNGFEYLHFSYSGNYQKNHIFSKEYNDSYYLQVLKIFTIDGEEYYYTNSTFNSLLHYVSNNSIVSEAHPYNDYFIIADHTFDVHFQAN